MRSACQQHGAADAEDGVFHSSITGERACACMPANQNRTLVVHCLVIPTVTAPLVVRRGCVARRGPDAARIERNDNVRYNVRIPSHLCLWKSTKAADRTGNMSLSHSGHRSGPGPACRWSPAQFAVAVRVRRTAERPLRGPGVGFRQAIDEKTGCRRAGIARGRARPHGPSEAGAGNARRGPNQDGRAHRPILPRATAAGSDRQSLQGAIAATGSSLQRTARCRRAAPTRIG